jgi:hypothetical protein
MLVIVVMAMVMSIVAVAVLVLVSAALVLLFSMRLSMRRALVLQPELRNSIANNAPQSSKLAQCVPNAILEIVR